MVRTSFDAEYERNLIDEGRREEAYRHYEMTVGLSPGTLPRPGGRAVVTNPTHPCYGAEGTFDALGPGVDYHVVLRSHSGMYFSASWEDTRRAQVRVGLIEYMEE